MSKLLGMFVNDEDKKDKSDEDNENSKNETQENMNSSSSENSNSENKENKESGENKTSPSNEDKEGKNEEDKSSHSNEGKEVKGEKNQNSHSNESKDTQREDNNKSSSDNQKLRLHKEELSINKNMVHAGDVELSTEIIEEKKSMDVPFTCEEVVIETKVINNESSDSSIGKRETIRIPVGEEKVEVKKQTVVTGEVTAYKRKVENKQHIEETLKSEKARVTKVGNPTIITKDNSDSSDE